MLLVTLMATASMGMSASSVAKESAAARDGQRLRTKLLPTSTQKCANRSSRLNSCSAPVWTPDKILMSRENGFIDIMTETR